MSNKIRIGISSCLLGNAVRYDGGHKLNLYLKETLGGFVEWVPICPEVECGLPVPREAMQLRSSPNGMRLVAIESGTDHTERMARWIEEKIAALADQNLRGFVMKARSPSCAVRDAEIVSLSGEVLQQGPGLFAAALKQRFPSLPVDDEDRLQDPDITDRFIARAIQLPPVIAFHRH